MRVRGRGGGYPHFRPGTGTSACLLLESASMRLTADIHLKVRFGVSCSHGWNRLPFIRKSRIFKRTFLLESRLKLRHVFALVSREIVSKLH